MVAIIGWIIFFVVFIAMMSLMGSPSSFETGLSFVIASVAAISVVMTFDSNKNKKGISKDDK